jgi:hypothetical protein
MVPAAAHQRARGTEIIGTVPARRKRLNFESSLNRYDNKHEISAFGGVKRTWPIAARMSAFDPLQTKVLQSYEYFRRNAEAGWLRRSKIIKGGGCAMMLKSLSLVALAVASVVVAGPSLAQQPIRIGASIAITGRDNVQGGYVREGYLLCQKDVNEKGGLFGRPIEFLIRDDGSDPKTAVGLYEKLIVENQADAVMGPYGSASTDAVADVTEKSRKLMIAPAAGTTSIWEKGRKYLIMSAFAARRRHRGND